VTKLKKGERAASWQVVEKKDDVAYDVACHVEID